MPVRSFAIISDNLAGYVLAARLERAGQKVILIHTSDGEFPSLLHAPRLPYYPATSSLKTALEDLSDLCGESIITTELEEPPFTFDEGLLKPFVGFGESKAAAISLLAKYNGTKRLALNIDIVPLLADKFQNLKAKRHTFSELSGFKFDGEKITHLMMNGGQEVAADHFVFMNSPIDLLTLLPSELLGARLRGRMAKTPVFTEVTVVLKHQSALYAENNLVFIVPSNAQHDAFVGQCLNPSLGLSCWQTFIEDVLSEDTEHVSNVIKNMRRYVRKAFGQNEDPAPLKLNIATRAAGDFAWLAEQKDIDLIAKNFTLVPTLSSSFTGLAQFIDAADSAAAKIHRINVDLRPRHVLDTHP